MYRSIPRRSPTLIGKTQAQEDPGDGFVRGAWHIIEPQSRLGGGGGNTLFGCVDEAEGSPREIEVGEGFGE